MSCRRHDEGFNGHLPNWGVNGSECCQACGRGYKWWAIIPCDVQLERRQIAEQRAKAGRPWWGALLGVLFVLGTSMFVFFAVRGLLR